MAESPKCGGRSMHEGPCADAEDGEKPGLPSLRHASPDDLEGIRTRQKVEGDPGH